MELDQIADAKFNVREQGLSRARGGRSVSRAWHFLPENPREQSQGSEICPLSTLKDMYEIVRDSDKLVTF